jgi:hypothetical protein
MNIIGSYSLCAQWRVNVLVSRMRQVTEVAGGASQLAELAEPSDIYTDCKLTPPVTQEKLFFVHEHVSCTELTEWFTGLSTSCLVPIHAMLQDLTSGSSFSVMPNVKGATVPVDTREP